MKTESDRSLSPLGVPLLSEAPAELDVSALSSGEKRALKKLGRLLAKLDITF